MKLLLGTLIVFYFLFITPSSFAQSEYVLPYPSAMPGSVFYKLNLIKEEILKYWYFGDFGKFRYNLRQSDKYLVEAKILFDYKQYLLAQNALKKSDSYFEKIYPSLLSAEKSGKDISEKEQILKMASQKHIEELKKIRENVPFVFEWTPEREKPTTLRLWENLDASIKLREDFRALRHSGKLSQVPDGTWLSASRISTVRRDAGQASMTFGYR